VKNIRKRYQTRRSKQKVNAAYQQVANRWPDKLVIMIDHKYDRNLWERIWEIFKIAS